MIRLECQGQCGQTKLQAESIIVLAADITARLSEAFAAGRESDARRLLYGVLMVAIVWSVAFSALLWLLSYQVMNFFISNEFVDGASVLNILAVAQIGLALNVPIVSFILAS